MALTMVEAAVSDTVHRDDSRVDDEEAEEGEVKGIDFIDLSSDEEEEEMAEGGSEEEDEEDTESLSQRIKRIRGDKPGELESGKVDVLGQSDSVGTLGNDQQKSSSVRIEGLVATTAKMVSKPEDSKVAAFLQEKPVKTENFDRGMPKTMLLPSQGPLASSATQEGSSKIDYCKAGIGGKGRSCDGAPARGVSQLSKGIAETNKTPAVQSSAKCRNKEVGAEKCASLSIPSEEPRITRDVIPFEPCKESNTYVQVKWEMCSLPSEITSKWDSEGHMVTSLLNENNIEFYMQALCALYRQGKLSPKDKRVEVRAKKLAEFLLDGDLQGPMKRSAEELQKQDVAISEFLLQVTVDHSEKLYGIFRYKEDPYFF
ncbi:histone H3.v1-like [Lolium rigidum]|uniref:histone H3.v1-like n=1 Tax=Lolium rigidum TaxID=89674 RepID=UPI001F5D5B66|nr:histone H3.v1-like [Lolium rigidum]